MVLDPLELTQHPSRAFNLSSYLASRTTKIQWHCLVCGARRIGPRTLTAWTHVCVKKNFWQELSLVVKSYQNRIEVVTTPDGKKGWELPHLIQWLKGCKWWHFFPNEKFLAHLQRFHQITNYAFSNFSELNILNSLNWNSRALMKWKVTTLTHYIQCWYGNKHILTLLLPFLSFLRWPGQVLPWSPARPPSGSPASPRPFHAWPRGP